jgi:O-antigen biosynthesis protein
MGRGGRIYQGIWGSAPFQSLYEPAPGVLWSLSLMPEWYFVILAFAVLAALGIFWRPLLLALLPLALAVGALLAQAALGAARASFTSTPGSRAAWLKLRSLTAALYLLQPLARLYGRLRCGLTPWRRRGAPGLSLPRPRTSTLWSERWRAPAERLHSIEAALRAANTCVRRGGDYDRWDLEVRGGILGTARMRMATEEHGAGRQLVRFRSWPRYSAKGLMLTLLFAAFSTAAALDHAGAVSVLLGVVVMLLTLRTLQECATALAAVLRVLEHPESGVAYAEMH